VSHLTAIFGPQAVAALEALIDARVEAALATSRGSNGPEWLSVESAARYLDVSPERVRKLQARGELPFHQEAIGARVFFRRSDLDEAMSRWRIDRRREEA
jgi:excisionase family DNA binding protein